MATLSKKKPKAPVRGHRNLLAIFDSLNVEYFKGMVCGGIGWRPIKFGEDSWTLGICDFNERLIKINTVLDDLRVPVWFLQVVVYHEMLHLHLGPQQYNPDGTADPHGARFRSLEVRHANHDRAIKFEETKLESIVNSWKIYKKYTKR